MAIVLQHRHFCPLCEDTWTCTCWTCDLGFDELACNACKMMVEAVRTRMHDSRTKEAFVDVRGSVVAT
jgi:hypothetical protein